ncbi:hypothetical protein PROFUN_06180 [Planoprotostelium fungivorum]|uniref:Right handed beta helix domain-containing protein n=1 Tax=Planoprotostelium fungivorum TaxID=1890364 RepID=A0A2P6MYW9_9EUKA|nr:hypothetical protein PROFUN_06180 [Planoprotostelium fungivorum]
MILRTLCLSLFLCIAIVKSIDECEVYVDSQSGSDVATCGQKQQPCRSIPYNSMNVCVSSGQYNVTDWLPSQLRQWSPAGLEAQTPQITCLNRVKISCDGTSALFWNHVDITLCSVVSHTECGEITFKSVHLSDSRITVGENKDLSILKCDQISVENTSLNSIISDCHLNNTFLSIIHSPLESAETIVSSPSHFRFISNHLSASSFFSFEDKTVGSQSHQEIINNTGAVRETVNITWSGASNRENTTDHHLLVENNTLYKMALHIISSTMPDVNLTGNRFHRCDIHLLVPAEDRLHHHSTLVQNNTISNFRLYKDGPPLYGLLTFRSNDLRGLRVMSDGLVLVMQHNHIDEFSRWEKGYVPTMADNITDNTISFFSYEVVHSQYLKRSPGVTHLQRNTLSTAKFIISSIYPTEILMSDTTWSGPNEEQMEHPALLIKQILDGNFVFRNSSIDGYRGGGIKIAGAYETDIYIESVSISNCGSSGIFISSEDSFIRLKSITLYNNTSPSVGGAIVISGHGKDIVVRDCVMINNRSPHGSSLSISSNTYIEVKNVSVIVQDDIDQPLVDHSALILNGNYHYENVSLSCAEERYLASSNVSSSLVWSCRPCATGTYFLGRGEVIEDVEKGNECMACPDKGVDCVDGKTPRAMPNYWCGKNTVQQLICHNCPSGYCNETAHLWNSSCIGHRSGELCGGCADGYTLGFLTSACLPVDHCRHEWIALLSIIPFIYVAVLLFLPIGDGAVWKSMSYFVQTVPLLLKQERQNSVISMFSSLFTTPTNMGSSSLGFCIDRMDYIQRELLSLYIPAGTIFIFLLACLSALLYHKTGCTMPRRKIIFLTKALDKRSMLSRCTTGLVAGFLLMYSGLIASYLKLYFCIEIEPERWVMHNAGTERCDQWWRIPFVSVASILLLPSPLVLIFIRSRLRGTERETGRDVLMVLDGCYRQSTKYWESVYMVSNITLYRKMGCTMPRRKIIFLTQALNKRSMLSRCTTGLVAGFLLMYSGLIASYLKLYFCIEIEPERWVMYNAGTESCDQWWRTILVSTASIVLLPLPLVIIFIRRRLKGTEREIGRDVLIVLDGCYRQSTKYWESVYMARRVVIAVAYVFITDERWSATVMRFLLLTALFLHLFFTPFITVAGQTLETICLLSLCCLTVLNGQIEERYSHIYLVITALPFLASLIIIIHKFWMKRKKKDDTQYEPLLGLPFVTQLNGKRDRTRPHVKTMILRTLCLSLLLCIAIVKSIDECEVYVDSQSGSDVTTCGQKQQPCRSIPHNSTNVCVSSGQYSVTERLPSVMRDWQPDGTEAQTELPQITCLNDVEIPCERQFSLSWSRLEFRNCNIVITDCRQIYPTNASVSSINGCLLNDTTLRIYLASPPVSSVESSSGSLTRFIGNHLLGSSSFAYTDRTFNSIQEIINNTHESTPTFYHRPFASTISIMYIESSAGYEEPRQLLLEDNAVPSVVVWFNDCGLPNTRIAGNRLEICRIHMHLDVHMSYAATPTIEDNVINQLFVDKNGPYRSLSTLVVRRNMIRYMKVSSDGLPLVIHHNDILSCLIEGRGDQLLAVSDTITHNNMNFLSYKIFNNHPSTPGHTNITRNIFSRAEIIVAFRADANLFLVDNIWRGPTTTTIEQPALHISQILQCSLHLSNSSMDGYPAGGLWISDASSSEVHIESLRVSSSGGGVLIYAEKSHIYLDSVTLCDNDSPTVGGGISILDRKYKGNDSSVVIRNTRMMNNRSPHGSAVFISAGSIKMENVSIIVEDDIDQPLVDHSVVVLNGHLMQEDVSLLCAEERYLASSNVSSSLVWSCRPCATGTYFLGRGEVIEDAERGNKCTRCPEKGVECVDGKTPQAEPNYWCGKNTSQQLICHNCPSGYCNETAHLWNSSCIGHRSGELCGGCADGYTLGFLTSACLPVDHCRHEWIALLSMVPVVYVAVLLFVPIGDGSMWKSMSYFVQTIPLLLKQERQNSVITMFSSMFTTPTNMGSSSWLGFCTGQMNYIEREFLSLYVPAGTVCLFLILCVGVTLYRKMGCTMPRRKIIFLTQALNKRSMLSRCTTGLVAGFLLMYSGLIASYLKLYFCIEIEPERWVMYNAGTERCNQWWRTPFVSVASILLLPSPLALIFIRSRLRGTERETGRDVLMVLDGCYRQSRKYWESVYMARRVVIAVAYVFITDEQWSATVMRFLLLTALFLHLVFSPFVTVAGQWLETMCLLSLCCLTLLNGQPEYRYSHAFLGIIALPFVASLIIVIHKLWMKQKKKYTQYEPLVTSEELLYDYHLVLLWPPISQTCVPVLNKHNCS